MCKSAIYTALTASKTVTSGGVISAGNIIRRFGRNCQLYGDSIMLEGSGYYEVKATVSFTPTSTTADSYTVQLYKDGIAIPGAIATVTGSTAVTLPINAIVKNQCCAESALTLGVTAGTATNTVTLTNVAVVVEKL